MHTYDELSSRMGERGARQKYPSGGMGVTHHLGGGNEGWGLEATTCLGPVGAKTYLLCEHNCVQNFWGDWRNTCLLIEPFDSI